MFGLFWTQYPRKIAKGAARKAYAKANASHDEIMAGLERSIAHWKSEKTEPKFIPHPSTWLNQERWTDEYDCDLKTEGEKIAERHPETWNHEEWKLMLGSPSGFIRDYTIRERADWLPHMPKEIKERYGFLRAV